VPDRIWKQAGFAIVVESTVGPPLVLGFYLPRWEADAEMARIKERCGDLTGTTLASIMESARVVPASLSFTLEPDA
jgi:hypothetical protein